MHVLESPRKQRRKVRPWEWVLLVPALIIWAVFWLTPILGLAAISDVRYASIEPDPEQAIPLAGVFYACALLYLIC